MPKHGPAGPNQGTAGGVAPAGRCRARRGHPAFAQRRPARPIVDPARDSGSEPTRAGFRIKEQPVSAIPDQPGLNPPRVNQWVPEPGIFVELRCQGVTNRAGRIETVMPDGTGFWLEAHGPDTRLYVDVDADLPEIWIRSDSASGELEEPRPCRTPALGPLASPRVALWAPTPLPPS